MSVSYQDRDNFLKWRLHQDGDVVQENTVTRAVLRFPSSATGNDFYLDTAEDEEFSLIDSATAVEAKLGMIEELRPGLYGCLLTVYDAQNTNGLAWAQVTVKVRKWPATE